MRKFGLSVKLRGDSVELENDVNVCNEGDVLTLEQCGILQIFGVKMAKSKGQPDEQLTTASDQKKKGEDEDGIELRTAGDDFEPYMESDAWKLSLAESALVNEQSLRRDAEAETAALQTRWVEARAELELLKKSAEEHSRSNQEAGTSVSHN